MPRELGKESPVNTKTRLLVLGTLLAIAVPAAPVSAQTGDPVIGTWELNVAKSTYSLGGGPKSSTRTYVAVGKGYKLSVKGTDADGKPVATEFTANYDGKNYPVTGNANVDSIKITRVDANTIKATQTKAGKVVNRTTRVISTNGKLLTSTATGKNAAGKAFTNVELFDKK